MKNPPKGSKRFDASAGTVGPVIVSDIAPIKAADLLDLPASLLVKLGSIAVHAQEAISPGGHPLDFEALRGLTSDPEVLAWLQEMNRLALLPVKR